MSTPMARTLKGLVLAAGLGTRLRPLTEKWPKPLIPFAGTTALELALWRLWRAGVNDVVVNSHYLPEQIAAAVRANPFGQKLHVSHEPEILGTGGVYNPLRAWLGDADLVVLNGDVISTVDVAALIERHQEIPGAVATMALLPHVIPGESGVSHKSERVLAIGKEILAGARQGTFACAQILAPELLDLLPKTGFFDVISKGYQVALQRQMPIGALVHAGFWHDLRTPSFYAAALWDYLHHGDSAADPTGDPVGVRACRERRGLKAGIVYGAATIPYRVDGPVLCDDSAIIDPGAHLGPDVIVEADVRIGRGASVQRSVLLPGAVVPAGAEIAERIIGAGFTLPIQVVQPIQGLSGD